MNSKTPPPLRTLYPQIEARKTGRLRVSALHEIYWEESGNPVGLPVIALHGGPGGGSSPEMRRFFDPNLYRIVLADQRGCGKSTPHSELRENNTWALVEDMEALRIHLGIERWVVFGGSWGSTLALAYAVTHPQRVLALVLRGIFLIKEAEIRWFYQEGASNIFPDLFEAYQSVIPPAERYDMLAAFHRRLTGPDPFERRRAARAWAHWEGSTLSMAGSSQRPQRFDDETFLDAFSRIECHYFTNKGFFPEDGWLVKQAGLTLRNTPGTIVHGRYDVITPLSSAWSLKAAWPEAELKIIPDAGHSSLEPGTVSALVEACDGYAQLMQPVR